MICFLYERQKPLFMRHPISCLFTCFLIINGSSYGQIPQLWGITNYGGPTNTGSSQGIIFKINADGSGFSSVHGFGTEMIGGLPSADFCLASNGKLYGFTDRGGAEGAGVLFEYDLNTNHYTKKIDLNSSNGGYPDGSLIQAPNGKLYSAVAGGGNGNKGTLIEYDFVTNTLLKKADFNNSTGSNPKGTMVLASNGKFYGITPFGGASTWGALFEYDYIANTLTGKFLGFNISIGYAPTAGLAEAPNGKLYGSTVGGGLTDWGTLFEFDYLTNTYTKKIDLDSIKGGKPLSQLMLASDGYFYGTTSTLGSNSSGTLFRYDYVQNIYTKLYDFSTANGSNPNGRLLETSNGILMGMTKTGGNNNRGVVFEYNIQQGIYIKKQDLDTIGATPMGSLSSLNGKLYGLTSKGGVNNDGTLFEITLSNNIISKKVDFSTTAYFGDRPQHGLTQAPNGKLYGNTYAGGIVDKGIIYEYNYPTNTFNKLIDFTGLNGCYPINAMTLASNGKMYGIMESSCTNGGTNGPTVYEFDYNTNTIAKKKVLGFSGLSVNGKLFQAANGKLYGTACNNYPGGINGVLFEYDYVTNTSAIVYDFTNLFLYEPFGSLTEVSNGVLYGTTLGFGSTNQSDIYEFNYLTGQGSRKSGTSGPSYCGLTKASNGKLYGVNVNGANGHLFEYDYINNTYINKFNFDGSNFGGYPQTELINASNNKLYGMNSHGGLYGFGVIFEYDYVNNTMHKIRDLNLDTTGGMDKINFLIETFFPQISLSNTLPSAFCAGNATNVLFNINGVFNAGNVFTAQLSDNNGSFASPVNIGTLASTSSGNISCIIPGGTLTGTIYRIRVISSNPVIISSDNGSNISINNQPSSISISGNAGFCRPSTGNIYNATPVQSGVIYNWTSPSGGSITNGAGTDAITVSFSASAVSGNVCVTASNSCGTSAQTCKAITLRTTTPSTPGTITGSNNGCPGDIKLYSIRKISNSDSYLWTPPIGATINGSSSSFTTPDTTVTVTFTPSYNGDTLRVKSINCIGSGTTERKLRINKNNPATPGTITGTTTGLCNVSGNSYAINSISNALSYTWRTNIAGATINGSTTLVTTINTVTANFSSFVSCQLYVKANNNCGSSAERSLTVYARPAVPASITGPVTVCDGDSNVIYSTGIVTNASTYNWTTLSGSTITNGQGTTAIKIKFGSTPLTGNVRVRSQNVCASSAYLTKSVTVNNCPRLMNGDANLTLKIQPNPFTNLTTIILPDEIDLAECTLVISDMFGRTIKTIPEPHEYLIIFERGAITSGIYNAQCILNNKMIQSGRMIIQ